MIQPQLEQKVFDMEREIRSLTQRLDKLEKLISGDASTEVRVTCGMRASACCEMEMSRSGRSD